MKRNYQKILDELLLTLEGQTSAPRLLLHSCCAPCSSYVLEYLSRYFEITVLYYNPNIYPQSEFAHRAEEQRRLIEAMPLQHPVTFLPMEEDELIFYDAVKGLEQSREGGERCRACYRLRMEKAAHLASAQNFDYFTTTLSISPMKNAAWLNEIGEELSLLYNVKHLCGDFKKKEGYKRSIQLSRQFNLYRQTYCGCIFSKREQEEKSEKRN